MSDDGGDTTVAWTVSLLDLPSELLVEIFLSLFNQQSVVSLRLTHRKLEDVYQRIADKVRVDQRERITAPIRNFVDFLDRFKLPDGRVRRPPPGGWPHIEPSRFSFKTHFAVDVLRHLSYIYDPEPQFDQYFDGCIAHRSTMVDYSETDQYQSGREDEWLETFGLDGMNHPPPSDERHILTLGEGWEGASHDIFIDTWTGLVYQDEDEGGPWAPVILAQDFFTDRIQSLKRFDEVFVPGEDTIFRRQLHYEEDGPEHKNRCWDPDERYMEYVPDDDPYDAEEMDRQGEYKTDRDFGCVEDADWIRHLYFKHGWPGENWDKEACLQAIREFVDRRHHQSGHYWTRVATIRPETI